ncbi:MAG: hypothetical protein Q8M40_12485 [Legionella sp.]|nr:hypothetical protein [Legionella sp.]
MSDLSWRRIGFISSIIGIGSAIGPAIMATLRGSSVKESTSVVGLGTAVYAAGWGIATKFGLFAAEKKPLKTVIIGNVLMELVGTCIGYAGANLFMNAAASKDSFVDMGLGLPISQGSLVCFMLLIKYYDSMQKENQAQTHNKYH